MENPRQSGEVEARETPVEEERQTWIPRRDTPPDSRPSLPADTGLAAAQAALRSEEIGEAFPSLRARCARRVRDRALLLDADRLCAHAHALALASWRCLDEAGRVDPAQLAEESLTALIDQAIEDLLQADRAAEERSGGLPPEEGEDDGHGFLARTFGLEPGLALAASVRFNGLPESDRRAFTHLVLEGRTIAECVSMGLGTQEELGSRARRGLFALFLVASEEPSEVPG